MKNWLNRKRIKYAVKKALDIELNDWQIDYILRRRPFGSYLAGAAYGKSTAQALYLLLSPSYKHFIIRMSPYSIKKAEYPTTIHELYGADSASIDKQTAFLNLFTDIREKLINAGIKVNDVRAVTREDLCGLAADNIVKLYEVRLNEK